MTSSSRSHGTWRMPTSSSTAKPPLWSWSTSLRSSTNSSFVVRLARSRCYIPRTTSLLRPSGWRNRSDARIESTSRLESPRGESSSTNPHRLQGGTPSSRTPDLHTTKQQSGDEERRMTAQVPRPAPRQLKECVPTQGPTLRAPRCISAHNRGHHTGADLHRCTCTHCQGRRTTIPQSWVRIPGAHVSAVRAGLIFVGSVTADQRCDIG